MEVGIIGGTGPAGRALGARLSLHGASVVIGSRQDERARAVSTELHQKWGDAVSGLRGGSNAEAASQELVVLATPWEGAAQTVLDLKEILRSRVVVSMVNALARVGQEFQALVPVRGSIAATIQALIPESRVSAAFQHLPARRLAALDRPVSGDVLVCADDAISLARTVELVESIEGLHGIEAGSLGSANAIEALTAVLLNVNTKYKKEVALRFEGLHEPDGEVQ